MGVFAGPEVVEDGLVLCLDAGNPKKSYKTDNNLLDLSTWYVGANSTTGVTGFGFNETDSGENTLIADTDPFGNTAVIWKAQSPDGGADGGWNTNYIDVDHTKLYRFSVWVNRKVTGTDGRFYFGTRGYNSSLSNVGVLIRSSGNNSTNPYFYYSSQPPTSAELPEDEWVLVVAHVWPSGSGTGSNKEDSGIYNTDGTKRNITTPSSLVDMVWNTTVTKTAHRTYLFYSEGDASVIQHWAYPRIDLVDGTEPSISDLINNRVNDRYWYDLSGNGNNGTLVNGVGYVGTNGGSLSFDGVDDKVTLSSNNINGLSSGTTEFSILTWVKYNSTTLYTAFFEKQNGTGTTIRLDMGWIGNVIYLTTSNSDGTTVNQGSFTYGANNPNLWYHIALTCGGSSKKGYVNSVNTFSQTFTSYYPDNTYNLGIGGNIRELNGNIAQTLIYNKALTAQEIQQNFNATRSRFGI